MEPGLPLRELIPFAGILIGLVAVLLPALIVFIVFYYKHRREEAIYAMVRHLADKGMPVPRELLDPPRDSRERQTPLFNAITLLGVGVGLSLMFYLLGIRFLIGIGLMLFCIGVAQLIAVWIEGRRRPDRELDSPNG